jgi:hypothetical protein
MDPLQAVECVIGPVHNWPSYILHHLFIEDPDNYVLKNVSAFMYGHGIGFKDAWMCFNACNKYGKEFVIKEEIKKHYDMWNETPHKLHEDYYYDMFKKKFVFINGDLNHDCRILIDDWLCLNVDNIERQEERAIILYHHAQCIDNEIQKCSEVMRCAIDKIRDDYRQQLSVQSQLASKCIIV